MGIATGLTAERMQEIIDKQYASGAVDLAGHLIFTRNDGSTVDMGRVKGDMASNPGHPTPYGSAITYVRIAVIDGVSASAGAQLIFDFAGGSNYSKIAKYSARVHVGQRGADAIQVDVYELGEASGDIAWGIVKKGTYLFELWARLPTYAGPVEVQVQQAWNATAGYDLEATALPTGWDATAVTVQRMGQKDPVGTIVMHASTAVPAGWLLCNGLAISRVNFRDLFALLGTRHGAGDGSTTFNIPDISGRVPVGTSTTDGDFNSVGEVGGEKTHLLTVAEMPSHTHTQNVHGHSISDPGHSHPQVVTANTGPSQRKDFVADGGGGTYAQGVNTTASTTGVSVVNTTATNQNTGGGGAHNNLQPYMALNFIIKY